MSIENRLKTYETSDFIFETTDRTASTSDAVRRLAKSSAEPLRYCLTAAEQTRGRGRRGRGFFSPPGGIYFSFTVPLTGKEKNIPFLTQLAGLAAARATQARTGLDVRIKWPNDLYVCGKKVCGILTELVGCPWGPAAIVGVGVNNRSSELPEELAARAAFLEDFGAVIEDSQAFVRDVVAGVCRSVYVLGELDRAGEDTLAELRARSYSIGRRAVYGGREAVVLDIADDGALLLGVGGETVTVRSGEIVHFDDSSG